ncbi:hypothetical protein Ciccas_003302 [Cichlidogyrus casuarinus]|uniref:Uncharacterized protein n=1 Tax=Cichlidogyrus casuarinus TaxID=1844966 RepID=A0ABD2QEY0_9PLAT
MYHNYYQSAPNSVNRALKLSSLALLTSYQFQMRKVRIVWNPYKMPNKMCTEYCFIRKSMDWHPSNLLWDFSKLFIGTSLPGMCYLNEETGSISVAAFILLFVTLFCSLHRLYIRNVYSRNHQTRACCKCTKFGMGLH